MCHLFQNRLRDRDLRVPHSPLGEVELVESDRTAERVLCVLHHLQDVLFTVLFFASLRRNLWI